MAVNIGYILTDLALNFSRYFYCQFLSIILDYWQVGTGDSDRVPGRGACMHSQRLCNASDYSFVSLF